MNKARVTKKLRVVCPMGCDDWTRPLVYGPVYKEQSNKHPKQLPLFIQLPRIFCGFCYQECEVSVIEEKEELVKTDIEVAKLIGKVEKNERDLGQD